MAQVKRWEKHKSIHNGNDTKVTEPSAGYPNATLADETHTVRVGQMLASGEAYFPVMTENELAAISVSASAPADELKTKLAEHGVCVVTGILSQQECSDFERYWQADLLNALHSTKGEESSQAGKRLQEEGITTWPQEWSTGLGKKGTASQRGLPHGSFAWRARLHAAVRGTFAKIYDKSRDELAVGLDCVFWSSTDSSAAESNAEWLHCDQNHRTGMTWPCVQGVLYVWPSEGERASTTVVWPGSHRDAYQKIMDDANALKRGESVAGQTVRLSRLSDPHFRDTITSQAVAGSRRVPCPAGSLLLWDSRTIHQGWAGGPRLAQPVCWEPRERRERDADALRRKMLMCATGLPSSHSSSEARIHGMAPRARPCEMHTAAGGPVIRAQIVPYCIDDKDVATWEAALPSLWGSRRHASEIDVAGLSSLLKPEVLGAL